MIRHAWSVLCEKSIVDSDTNNISLDAIEELTFVGPPLPPAGTVMIPCRLEFVSMWYRASASDAERREAVVRIVSPNGQDLGRVTVDVDLTRFERLRTRCQVPGLPVNGEGRYLFVLSWSNDATPIAEVPLAIRIAQQMPAHPQRRA